MNFKELIQIGATYARIDFPYKGTPAVGMLAWLDSAEVQQWWKADSAIIEPFPGGMFYLTWGEIDSSRKHAIYGVMDKVDTENHIIEITKILYIFPAGKMGHLHLHIRFEPVHATETKMIVIHSHQYSGQLLKLYNAAVYNSWPKTFTLLKRYFDRKAAQQPSAS